MKRTLVLGCAALLLMMCHRGGDPVEDRVNELAAAVEHRDATAIASSLTDDFRASDGEEKQQIADTLHQYLAGYKDIDIAVREMKVARTEDHGSADFIAEMNGSPRTIGGLDSILPRSAKLHVHVTMRVDGGSWKIDSASWERRE